jgi:hypothetical protein
MNGKSCSKSAKMLCIMVSVNRKQIKCSLAYELSGFTRCTVFFARACVTNVSAVIFFSVERTAMLNAVISHEF